MKKPLFISALVLAAIGSFAQGTIGVGNGITSTRFPIYGPQVSNGGIQVVGSSSLSAPTGSTVYEGGLLSGTRYAIEFWAGPSTATDFSGLTLIRSTTFRTGATATALPNGITTTIVATVPGVAAGMSAKLGVRVWDTQAGATYELASIRGQSPTLFLSAPLGGVDGGGGLVISPNWVGQSFSLPCLDCYPPPMIFQHPLSATSTVGGNVNFFLTASYVSSYQWRKDGVNIAGAATNSLSLTNVTLADAGNYDVVLANVVGSSTSAVATLTILTILLPPTISQPPQSQVVIIGSNASFSVTAAGTPTLTYQWRKNSLNIGGAVATNLSLTSVTTNDGGGYDVVVSNPYGSITSSVTALTVVFPPSITTQPTNQTLASGSIASFGVTATGTDPLSYQWEQGGTNISGATNALFTLNAALTNNAGDYRVVVSNPYGQETSFIATLTVFIPASLSSGPVSQLVAAHDTATFSVAAFGYPALNYQWRFDGADLPGATSSSLVITNVGTNHLGYYWVEARNAYNAVTSSPAALLMSPSLRVPFAGGVNLWGQPATLTVGAVGTGPLVYQWYFNGQTIAGATSNSYTIPTIQFTNAGFYSVVVSSSLGSVTNTPYQVVVNPANVSLGLYPGITVSGTVGYTYTIQGTTDLSDTNAWVTLANLTLTQPVQIWSDYTADTTQSQNPRKFYRVVAGNVPVGMALIPAGPFTMGDTLDGLADAAPVTVTVSAFYMDTNVVSKAQWDDVYTWAIGHGYTFDNVGSGKASTHPVQTINWYDSVKWCNARSEKEGRSPAYYTDAGFTTVYRSGQLSPSVNWAAGYRLPTEAEWEKAARGGLNQNRFPWGNTISQSLANFNNVAGESYQTGPTGFNAAYATGAQPYTSPVGSFAPNGYGLFDMAGNVWQWCWDWHGTPYAGGADPRGAASGSDRVVRGGDWNANAFLSRTAYRYNGNPTISYNGIFGFRSVLPPGQ